jgi:hypothetical protein
MEGKEWVIDNGQWKEVDYDHAKKALNEASRRDFEDVALRQFKNFLSKL